MHASLRDEDVGPSLARVQRDDESAKNRPKFGPQTRVQSTRRRTFRRKKRHLGQNRRALRIRSSPGPALQPERSGRSGIRHRNPSVPVRR